MQIAKDNEFAGNSSRMQNVSLLKEYDCLPHLQSKLNKLPNLKYGFCNEIVYNGVSVLKRSGFATLHLRKRGQASSVVESA